MDLQAFPTEAEMHGMMLEKGFILKSDEEVARIKRTRHEERETENAAREKRKEMEHKRMLERLKKYDGGEKTVGDDDKKKDSEEAVTKGVKKLPDLDFDIDSMDDSLSVEEKAARVRELKRQKWNKELERRRKEEEAAGMAAVGDEL